MSLSHNQKHSHIHKKRLNREQVKLLEASFDPARKLGPELKMQLARALSVPPRQIAIWHQNKRARWKNQSLGIDYCEIQAKLESAVADNKSLEEQVRTLNAELKGARDLLMSFGGSSSSPPRAQAMELHACASRVPPVSSLSSCCDESSLHDDVGFSGSSYTDHFDHSKNNDWCYDEIRASMKYQELYDCLMVGSKGTNQFDHRDFSWL